MSQRTINGKTYDIRAGADLSEAKLSRADLSEADLLGAKLSKADLFRANLSGAKIDGTPNGQPRTGTHHAGLDYQVGAVLSVDDFDPDPRVECSRGLHVWLTRDEAEAWP